MSDRRKRFFIFSFLLIGSLAFFLSPKIVVARVVINEFSSLGSSDWVEIYRSESENLSLYKLEDGVGNVKELSWGDCVGNFCVVDWNKLDQAGDIIKLFLVSNPSQTEDQVAYGDSGNDVAAPGVNQSAGRIEDGGGYWVIFSTPTKGSTNNAAVPVPTATPSLTPAPTETPILTPSPTVSPTTTSTPTPSLTSTPSAETATYRINEVKNKDDDILSNVKVYVDDQYTHHYAPETLTFGEGYFCDNDQEVVCGLGEHRFKLTKSGYQDWEETRLIAAGNSWEVNPVMDQAESVPTQTPNPTPTNKPTPTTPVTPSPTPSSSPTPTPEDSAEEATGEADLTPFEEKKNDQEEGEVLGETAGEETDFLPFIFIGAGLLFLAAAGAFFRKAKLGKDKKDITIG